MRCSNCSQAVKPVVAIDIDGTLGDYHYHLLKFAGEYLDAAQRLRWVLEHRLYDGSVPFSEWFTEMFEVDLRTFRDVKLAYRQGGQKRSMPAYPHARSLCRSARQAGAELWLCTTRPYLRLDGVDPDTREWLRRNQIEYDHLLYGETKYQDLAERVDSQRLVAALDDLTENLEEVHRLWSEPLGVLRRTEWNRAHSWVCEVPRLHRAQEIILNRINEWKELYA